MSLPKRYNPKTAEPALQQQWQEKGIYHFHPGGDAPVYSIDTPPPTVSGHLHLGHVYSYSHTDFMARFWRMNGYNVFYPMGFDDNGLPTERLVEKWENVTVAQIGRQAFIERCLAISEEAEKAYKALWQRLGLSVDWRYSYRTIDEQARRISQRSFVELFRAGRAYRQKAPTIWCPECHTAIAQAELDDLQRDSVFYTLAFRLENGETLPIATTRPELLPACVAIFVHPQDGRFAHLLGQHAAVPLFGRSVPILADNAADPQKGTGAVMCCTFGDQMDVAWWRTHNLPLIEAIAPNGMMTGAAGGYANLTTGAAHQAIIADADAACLLLDREEIAQSVRVHERCDTPVEYIVTQQWFIRLLDMREALLEAGEQIIWHPTQMQARYRQWVENLGWDWCISRQRTFGVPIPIWTCAACSEPSAPDLADLPVDPTTDEPKRPCSHCGNASFIPEQDVMDTWATSSMSPQIVTQWLINNSLHEETFPMTLRPQAHEIIRTWAFYTIAKSLLHFGTLPFREVAISGWGLAPEGAGKISKSRGGGPVAPITMIEQYSADAVRTWAASTGFGKDAIISEEKIQAGDKLVTKLWNVCRFSQRFLDGYQPAPYDAVRSLLSPADRWLLASTQQLVERVTALFRAYDYATAKSETETFFWHVLADNYLEMAKLRLYGEESENAGARYTLYYALLTTIKLFAPIMPYVTEQIYLGLFAKSDGAVSIHRAAWPVGDAAWRDETAVSTGELLVEIATAVRRYKSERSLSLGTNLARLHLATDDAALTKLLQEGTADLQSITRAQQIDVLPTLDGSAGTRMSAGSVEIAVEA